MPIIKEYLEKLEGRKENNAHEEKELGIMDFITEEFKDGKNIYGFESEQPWMEINNREQLKKARDFISKGKSTS